MPKSEMSKWERNGLQWPKSANKKRHAKLTASNANTIFCSSIFIVLSIKAMFTQIRILIVRVDIWNGWTIIVAVIFQIKAICVWSSVNKIRAEFLNKLN